MFSNKEVALERIEIEFLPQNEKREIVQEILCFDVRNAHAFGPGEEMLIHSLISFIKEQENEGRLKNIRVENVIKQLKEHPRVKEVLTDSV